MPVTLIDDFFRDIDASWMRSSERVNLRLIGSTALMLQTTYSRGTRDSDVLETSDLSAAVKAELLLLAGEGTVIAQRHHLYVEIVSNGIPFLPHGPLWHRHPCDLTHFDIHVLDVVDV